MRLGGTLGIVMGMESDGNIPRDAHGVDPGKCRVYELTTVDWIVCLEQDGDKCSHSSIYGCVSLCRHPERKRTLPLRSSTRFP